MQKIDVYKPISRVEFQENTNKMISQKEKLEELDAYKAAPEALTNHFLEEVSEARTNRASVFDKALSSAHNKYHIYRIIIYVLCLALYGGFYVLFPKISGIEIEQGWIFFFPMVLITVWEFLHLFYIDKHDKKIKKTLIALGIVLPVLGAIAAIFASEATGKGDTACVIAYFAIAIPGFFLPFIVSKDRILKRIKSKSKYKNEYRIATQKDEEETEKLRAEAEIKFHEYVRDYTEKRNELLSQAPQIKAEWECYENFYNEWKSAAEHAKTFYEYIFPEDYTVDQAINKMNNYLVNIPMDSVKDSIDFIVCAGTIAREKNTEMEKDIESIAESLAEISAKIHKR